MSRPFDEFFQIDAAVAEVRGTEPLHTAEALTQFCFVVAQTHPDTAAAGSEWAPYLMVHEFGHHFAALADEYYTSPVSYAAASGRRA